MIDRRIVTSRMVRMARMAAVARLAGVARVAWVAWVAAVAVVASGCGGEPEPEAAGSGPGGAAVALLSTDPPEAGFARALGPRPFLFPADHGPHPDYRHEWWYLTGNVESETGRHFGFQVTFFRFAAAPGAPQRPSQWAAHHLWMGHFAVTDTAAGRFHHHERIARGALGLAGAEAEPFRVWLEDWSLAGVAGRFDHLALAVREGDEALSLTLRQVKPLVFQGEGGYSRKGPHPGDASYYYTAPRLEVSGVVETAEGRHAVTGTAWLDREWGTGTLAEGQVGWDWFSIQLADGREMMFYHLRREDGTVDPRSKGAWVDAAGRSRVLGVDDVELEVIGHWRSPDGAARYPSGWRLRYSDEGLDLELTPRLADQELRGGTFRYWEGALEVSGTAHGRPITGVGYGELTGY